MRRLWIEFLPSWLRQRMWKVGQAAIVAVRKWQVRKLVRDNAGRPGPPPVEPVWPLPRRAAGPSDEEIRARFAPPSLWHYDYRFEGGLEFQSRHATPTPYLTPELAHQSFRHFMPWLLEACGGTLAGKRVLDIGCNSGFWAIQCALLGARDVVGIDARNEVIGQANFLRSVVGADNARFRPLDFWDMNPETLGGTFDVVLCLNVLFHLSDPLAALERIRRTASHCIVLQTMLCGDRDSVLRLHWEEPNDIQRAATAGLVTWPSRSAVELMFRHLGLSRYREIPVRSTDVSPAMLTGRHGVWLIDVR